MHIAAPMLQSPLAHRHFQGVSRAPKCSQVYSPIQYDNKARSFAFAQAESYLSLILSFRGSRRR